MQRLGPIEELAIMQARLTRHERDMIELRQEFADYRAIMTEQYLRLVERYDNRMTAAHEQGIRRESRTSRYS